MSKNAGAKPDSNPPLECASCGKKCVVAVGLKSPTGGFFLCRGCYVDPAVDKGRQR